MSEKETLTCRLIDRPVRPLFPEGYACETQIICMVISADPEQDPDKLAIVGAGAALAISDIAFEHVLGCVRVGLVNGVLIANPTYSESRESLLKIVVAATEGGIVMVEAGASQVSEAQVLEAIEFGHDCCRKIAGAIKQMAAACGKPKRVYTPPPVNQELYDQVSKQCKTELKDALDTRKYPKLESYAKVAELKKRTLEAIPEEQRPEAGKIYNLLKEQIFRDEMLNERRRPDARAFDEVRAISVETGLLPMTHGSPLFTRGESQACGP